MDSCSKFWGNLEGIWGNPGEIQHIGWKIPRVYRVKQMDVISFRNPSNSNLLGISIRGIFLNYVVTYMVTGQNPPDMYPPDTYPKDTYPPVTYPPDIYPQT